jgi:hypothetical protein
MSELRDFLSDTLLVLGVTAVFLSIIQPFLSVQPLLISMHLDSLDQRGEPRVIRFVKADFFTFKVTYDPGFYPRSEFWNTYWFNNENWLDIGALPSISYFLIATFAVQILALVLGFFTLPLKPRMRIVPLVLCFGMTFLMTWSFFSLRTVGSPRGFVYGWSLGDGFWLSWASLVCLLLSIILARGREDPLMFEG